MGYLDKTPNEENGQRHLNPYIQQEDLPQDPPSAEPQQAKPAKGPQKHRHKKGATIALLFAVGLTLAALLFSIGLQLRRGATAQSQSVQTEPHLSLAQLPTEQGVLTTPEIVEKVAPSVVSLELYEENNLGVMGSGSGFIISEDGYIITNNHVVRDYFAVRVVLADGQGFTAEIVAQDVNQDLAIIKIEASGLKPAEFGDSDLVKVGDAVVAIGNAAGLFPGSPTQGIISGVNREVTMETSDGRTVTRVLLQTDAAINPGNSGGALVNVYGQVIGINVAKLYADDIENIGFAIPSKVAMPLIERMIVSGDISPRPRIGVTLRVLNETNGPLNGLPSWGLYIEAIAEDSDLRNYNVQVGDVLMEADGTALLSLADLDGVLQKHEAGEEISLLVYRSETGATLLVHPKLLEGTR